MQWKLPKDAMLKIFSNQKPSNLKENQKRKEDIQIKKEPAIVSLNSLKNCDDSALYLADLQANGYWLYA